MDLPRCLGLAAAACSLAAAQADWDAGDPTAIEQVYIELINRARADPAAEGQRLKNTTDPDILGAYSYFGVDTTLMASELAAIAATPPLATNPNLRSAARGHAQYLFDNALQSHTGSGGSSLGGRLSAAGYAYTTGGENVFSYAKSALHGHAGFEVDWGSGTDGMQSGRGHRANIHNASFREIGIGVIPGTKTVGGNTVGPQVVVQDFGSRSGLAPYLLGVVYDDVDADGFYDAGEGAAGVTVVPSSGSYTDTTLTAGAYAFPTATSGTINVTFTHPSWGSVTKPVVLGASSRKVDARRSEFNGAPTISAIADQATSQNVATAAIPFTVGDAQTAASALIVTAVSSNQTLVPNAAVTLGGSGASRTVTLAPAAGQTGTTTITVTVSDGTLTADEPFLLTVNAGSTPAAPTTAPTVASPTGARPQISGAGLTAGVTVIVRHSFAGGATTTLGTATVAGNGTWTFTPSADLADGLHAITYAIQTAGGTSGDGPARTITVDTAAPATPSAPTVAGLALSGSTEANAQIRIYIDGSASPVATVTAGPGGGWSWTVSGVSVGAHTVTVRAVDAAGNASGLSGSASITVTSGSGGAAGGGGAGGGCSAGGALAALLIAGLAGLGLRRRRFRR